MPTATPLQTAFNAGEISPRALLRTDIDRYYKSAEKLENLIIQIQGGLTRRPGTLDVAAAKPGGGPARLMEFEFNAEQAYVLEVGQGYMRFFTRQGPLLSGGVPLEIVTPWTNFDPFLLRWAQSADTIRFVHPDYPPQILSRFAELNWTIAPIDFDDGPYLPINDQQITLQAAAANGNTTVTASSNLFLPGHVGSTWRIADNTGVLAQVEWQPGTNFPINSVVRFGSNVYSSTTGGVSGFIAPTHTDGVVSDGVVNWRYGHNGFGYFEITAVTSPTVAQVTVRSPSLPGGVVTAPSINWQEAAWSDVNGYPSAISFFEQRVVYADSNEPTLRYSATGDFDNFAPPGLIENTPDDGPIDGTLDSGQEAQIHWMVSRDQLLIGTSGGEWAISSSSGGPITPSDVRARKVTSTRAGKMDALFVRSSVLFAARGREKLHELVFDAFDSNNFQTPDMTRIADHILISGLVQMVHQQEPESLVWGCLTDGDLVSLSFDKVEQVVAWARHPMPGRQVQSVVAIPGSSSTNSEQSDELWLLVDHGGDIRIERMSPFWRGTDYGDALEDAYYVDSGRQVTGPVTVVDGLDHLESHLVRIFADGVSLPPQVVNGGQVTLPAPANKVSVGLPINYRYLSTKIVEPAPLGSPIAKKRTINEVAISLLDSCEVLVGSIEGELEPVEQYLEQEANPLLTGDYRVVFAHDWQEDRDPRILIENNGPCPFTLLALAPRHRAEST